MFCLTTVSTFISQDKAVAREWHTHKKNSLWSMIIQEAKHKNNQGMHIFVQF